MEYEAAAGPGKFMIGTEEGIVLACNRKVGYRTPEPFKLFGSNRTRWMRRKGISIEMMTTNIEQVLPQKVVKARKL
jgi:hypothetical protein